MQTAEKSPFPPAGDLAMWVFILLELTVFGMLIIAFGVTESMNSEAFRASRAQLNTSTGLVLTLSLLTSGYFGAMAVTQTKRGHNRSTGVLLAASVFSALFYVVIKIQEYSHLASIGLDIEYDTFFTLYWILTGFHFLHVLLGLVILTFMAFRAWANAYTPNDCRNLESGVLYWHMVDLVWVMLFPLVYVLN